MHLDRAGTNRADRPPPSFGHARLRFRCARSAPDLPRLWRARTANAVRHLDLRFGAAKIGPPRCRALARDRGFGRSGLARSPLRRSPLTALGCLRAEATEDHVVISGGD